MTPDERGVSWKILLPVGPESRICAIGLDEGGLAGLTRSYGMVDTQPVDGLKYDIVIIGDGGCDDLYDWCNLIPRIVPDGVVVNASRRCFAKKLKDAGYSCLRRYAALPPGEPKLFIPLASKKLRAGGLAFHSPGSLRARIGLTFAKALSCLGMQSHLARSVVSLYAKSKEAFDRQSLIQWLSEKLGYPVVDLTVYTGSDLSRRKITVLAIAEDGYADVVVKIADTIEGADAIRQESNALQAIAAFSLSEQAPKLIAKGQWYGYSVQLQKQVIGGSCRQVARLTESHLEFLSKLSTIGRKIMRLKAARMWRDVKAKAEVISLEALSPPIRVALETILSDRFADMPVVCHRTHGDFTPWNIKVSNGKLFVYDWEESLSDGLALTDIFRFIYRQASLVGPWPGAQKVLMDMRSISRSFSDTAGYETIETDVILTVWLLYEYFAKPSDYLGDMLDAVLRNSR